MDPLAVAPAPGTLVSFMEAARLRGKGVAVVPHFGSAAERARGVPSGYLVVAPEDYPSALFPPPPCPQDGPTLAGPVGTPALDETRPRTARVLGIDPGKDGAAVLLQGRRILDVTLTAHVIGDAKWQAAHGALCEHVRRVVREHGVDLAVLELYAGRAGEGRGSMLTIGVGWGLWLGVLSMAGLPVLTPTSATWARRVLADVSGDGKERSIAVARALGVNVTPGRRVKPHSGIADAACLALYGADSALGRVA